MSAFAFPALLFNLLRVLLKALKQGLIQGNIMNNTQIKSISIFAALAAMMAATRFSHFGTALALPDASLAAFFLGGLYLSRSVRTAIGAFIVLILEAGVIDYYATSMLGISDWCMTPAYWFLIPTYASLWLVGGSFAIRHRLQGKGLIGVILTAWAASSFAFVFSNTTFYLFSDRFATMNAAEYITRVAQYYVSYVSVALLYVACAIGIHVAFKIIVKRGMDSRYEVI